MFSSGQEAKEYLVAQITAEAEREGMPLSETERKMMYFTETGWTLPDMAEVNEAFERECDAAEYEDKIGDLSRKARVHAKESGESDRWKEAVSVLAQEDHYLLVLLSLSGSSDSFLSDRLKLVGTAFLILLAIFNVIFYFLRR